MEQSQSTIENNLIWLEQETKINTSLSIAQETKAKLNVLTLAVSTIADLTATIKGLKNEMEMMKTEMNDFKMEINKNKKKCLTDEEKEILRIQSTEIIRETSVFTENNNVELLNAVINIIIYKSKTVEQGIRVANKLKVCINLDFHRNIGSAYEKYGGIHLGYSKDYKIVYYALYEIKRSKVPLKHKSMSDVLKHLNDGGIDVSVQYAIGTLVGHQI